MNIENKKIFVILITILALIFSGCAESKNTKIALPEFSEAKVFEIYYSFGIEQRNILDTGNNLYIKDMVCNNTKREYEFQLNEAELEIIYDSLLEYDLFNIKEDLTKSCNWKGICTVTEPNSAATLKILVNEKTKTIEWNIDYFDKDDSDFKKFMNVSSVIKKVIYQKENELNIEKPNCFYL